jgi:RimJ/RimL family protein N-acetyltransferase
MEALREDHVDELVGAVREGGLEDLWYTLVPTDDQVGSYVADALGGRAAGTSMPFVVRSEATGRLLGSTRFCNMDVANQRAEIGYTWLVKAAQRTSVNSAAKFLILQHAFETGQAIAIEFRTHWHNLASRRAIERLGAKQDGVLRQHRQDAHGGYRDTVVYSILNSEWPPVRNGLLSSLNVLD